MKTAITALTVLALAGTASAQVYTGGGFTLGGGDQRDENIDITGLTGNYDGFVLQIDFGGSRPSDTEFDFDLRTLFRTDSSLPFNKFLEDSNFDFVYDANNILTVTEAFPAGTELNGGEYERLRLRLFNDTSSSLTVQSYTLTLVPAPGAVGLLAGAGLLASRRRR
jgi:hypothetical protein